MKVSESISDTFVSIAYVVLVANEFLILAFVFLLCFLSMFLSPWEVNIRPEFYSRRQLTSSRSPKLPRSPTISLHWAAHMCSGTHFKRI